MAFWYRNKNNWKCSAAFPDMKYALPSGLLAVGGGYDAACFLDAYRRGIFPWPCESAWGRTIPWFSPDPRFVVEPGAVHFSHSLRRTLKHHPFRVCADTDFEAVIRHCATVERADDGTWITDGMIGTFCALHRMGYAHSVECYLGEELVGGFYGMCLGRVFGGESMFTLCSDSTKVAFALFAARAAKYGIRLIDCQCYTDNMARYGAHDMPRDEYLKILAEFRDDPVDSEFWNWNSDRE